MCKKCGASSMITAEGMTVIRALSSIAAGSQGNKNLTLVSIFTMIGFRWLLEGWHNLCCTHHPQEFSLMRIHEDSLIPSKSLLNTRKEYKG